MTAVAARAGAAARAESRAETVRRLAAGALLAMGCAAIALSCWSLTAGGIGWDTRGDTAAALVTRSVDSSWTLQQAYDAVPETSEFYGVFLQQLADVLHLLTTGSTTPLQPDDPTTYLYQGAANLLLAVAAMTAFAVAIAVAFRSRLAGAFVWALTLSMPLWLGMMHVDFKDMPVASGLTLVSAGLILALALERRAMLAGALLAGAGGGIAVATRPGAIVLLGVVVGGTVAVALAWGLVRHRVRETLPVVVAGALAPVCGVLLTWATNPIARLGTVQWFRDSIDIARKYPWNAGSIRTAGKDLHSIDLPWWYVPAWLWAQLPLLTCAALVGGAGYLAIRLVRDRRRVTARETLPLVPLALQGIVLPVGIVASGAVLYDGIRHELFMVPALFALPAVALALLDRGAGRRMRVALPLAAVVVVAASLAASVRWAPYAYAFVNPIAGRNKDGRAWELDYWGVSAREGIRRLREAGYAPIYTVPGSPPGIPYGGEEDSPHRTGGKTAVYVFIRWDRASRYDCDVVFTIKRDGNALGEGARCPKDEVFP